VPLEIIKVCGITSAADALFAAQNGATALGFVFYAGSPRCLRVDEAAMIGAVVPRGVLRVGVFVNEDPEQIRQVANAARLDVVQLHGDEAPHLCRDLEGLRIWKAFRVGDGFSPSIIEDFDCEAFLLDGTSELSYGGSGRVFPWLLAAEAKQWGRIIVAGGLDGGNVVQAVQTVGPYGVDASSKLESRPGVKDQDKVRQYLEAAHSVKS